MGLPQALCLRRHLYPALPALAQPGGQTGTDRHCGGSGAQSSDRDSANASTRDSARARLCGDRTLPQPRQGLAGPPETPPGSSGCTMTGVREELREPNEQPNIQPELWFSPVPTPAPFPGSFPWPTHSARDLQSSPASAHTFFPIELDSVTRTKLSIRKQITVI